MVQDVIARSKEKDKVFVPKMGFEPMTYGLRDRCSTPELPRLS